LEWLIEHQDDSDDSDNDIDFLSTDARANENVAGPSSSIGTKKKFLKEACTELFKIGNSVNYLYSVILKYTFHLM
jgi:hypothetical protein